jgi:hypothetical protein
LRIRLGSRHAVIVNGKSDLSSTLLNFCEFYSGFHSLWRDFLTFGLGCHFFRLFKFALLDCLRLGRDSLRFGLRGSLSHSRFGDF